MIIGIPKGDLQEIAMKALGLTLERFHPRQLYFDRRPLEVLLVKTKDVMSMAAEGEVDVGVTCTAYREEWALASSLTESEMVRHFTTVPIPVTRPWSVSLLCLVEQQNDVPVKIFTEFGSIVRVEFPDAVVRVVGGSVEAHVRAQNAWGVTIVSSGETAAVNGLTCVGVLRLVVPCLVYQKNNVGARKFLGHR